MGSLGLWGDGVKLGMHQYFAAEHLGAARLMAEKAREREGECLGDPERDHGIDWDLRSYALHLRCTGCVPRMNPYGDERRRIWPCELLLIQPGALAGLVSEDEQAP